ncbi:alpha/beta-hydrolase [Peniophora sp. CONT]|nr:alpha/beta-hydrolase [Peniophora sp. CONT]
MSRQWASTPARALHPSTPPPSHLLPKPPLHLLPPNTSVPGPELAISGYNCSSHVFPAAWPRSTPLASLPEDLQERADESKEERKTRIARATRYILDNKAKREREQPDALDDSGRVLWVTATRWVRTLGVQAGVKTLLCTHANGLHGTTYTPILRLLLAQRRDVAEVWALDGVQHGDAGILNAGKNGIFFDWHDITRDILCFIQHFLPTEPTPEPMSSVLPRIGGGSRKVCALGHSFGGCALVLAASHYPELFSALMLVDAVIVPPELDRTISRPPRWVAHDGTVSTDGYPSLPLYITNTLGRRARWSSRAAVHEALVAHPFFSTWDKDVLDVYVEQALVEEEAGGEVRLKCDKIDEAAVYAEARASWEAWGALPLLDERVSLLWIDPPAGDSVVQTREFATARVRRRAVNSAYAVITNGTHLAVQTHPYEVAEVVQIFLQVVDAGDVGNARELKLQSASEASPIQGRLRAHI